ncbi:MAG: VOC family protein [Acidimicrobiales bacterium]
MSVPARTACPTTWPNAWRRAVVAELNAITLRTTDMAAAIEFYELIGCTTVYGGPDTDFATMAIDDFVPGRPPTSSTSRSNGPSSVRPRSGAATSSSWTIPTHTTTASSLPVAHR